MIKKIIIGIVLIALLLGGSVFLSSRQDKGDTPANVASAGGEDKVLELSPSGHPVDAAVISQSAPPPATHSVEYRNETYGFSYYHTPEAKITEYDEGSGAMTIVHENFQKVRGMQIFIVPYSESTISEERFKMDVPSGVRTNVENTTLDGVRAVTFNSFDQKLGETREIWVIHNGYLFEITTFKGVGLWFTPIIQSWRFLN